ncbi:conserved hypothetical protein [Talaromyces stipitatus ATCC 10500]|uniref:Uncharacterized protein n=1 Tax=Talaromyces stipitatus (strain ATCC 10500 / CBS 375.48 / QM 6759 / NRRL 1006) TaxID=441959 RepID=B8MIN7_TALSN|nr:uncharacterized protein TSTA_045850 [Talaromyces stipitatus ATCC 10500]EED15129.1 conserved hypothetical protein [Talaromyces stipitatus ATCC 10500]
MSTTTPESIPGFNAVGRTTGTTDDLKGLSFQTACPPDVGPRTRLVAICGITDEAGAASPEDDGWFLSDFYLFRHLFSHVDGPTPKQIWMTSEPPDDLVLKYKEYEHGDLRGERRIVLDKDMLPAIQQSGTLRVVPRHNLLQRFISTLKEQSRLAKENDEHLFLATEISIRLMDDVKLVLQRDVPTTLFMTSCFSGGWLAQTIANTSQHINATGITAAGPQAVSLGGPLSASLGRACGGRLATGILRSALAVEESQEMSEIREDPTYIAFANSVHETYKKLDAFAGERQIHFSAQDDRWGDHFISRSGLPLSRLKARWESLRMIPSGDYYREEDQEFLRTRSMRFGLMRKRRKLDCAARQYLSAKPGESSLASNIGLHGALNRFLRDEEKFSDEDISGMLEEVKYRIDALDQANKLAIVMSVNNQFLDAFSYDQHWPRSPEEEKIYSITWRLLATKQLVDKPSCDLRYALASASWTKPISFLAACFAKSGLTSADIPQRVALALTYKSQEDRTILFLFGRRTTSDAEVVHRRELALNKIRSWKAKVTGPFYD